MTCDGASISACTGSECGSDCLRPVTHHFMIERGDSIKKVAHLCSEHAHELVRASSSASRLPPLHGQSPITVTEVSEEESLVAEVMR